MMNDWNTFNRWSSNLVVYRFKMNWFCLQDGFLHGDDFVCPWHCFVNASKPLTWNFPGTWFKDEFASWFMNWYVNEFTSWFVYWLVNCFVYWFVYWFVNWFVKCFFDWFENYFFGWFVNDSFDWFVNWFDTFEPYGFLLQQCLMRCHFRCFVDTP